MFGFKKKEENVPRPLLPPLSDESPHPHFSHGEGPLIPGLSDEVHSMKRRVIGDQQGEDDISTLVPELEAEEQERSEDMVPYAPVFVKLERYGELLSDISKAEAIVERIKQLIALMDKIQTLHQHVYEGIRHGVKEVEEELSMLNSKFRKPEVPSTKVHKPKFSGVPIEQVQKELEDLKRELQSVKK